MGRQILTIEIGQAGIQIGSALWELYCMEHGVSANGDVKNDFEIPNSNQIDSLYYETKDGRFIPRSIFMDLEPTVIDEIRLGSYRDLFNPRCLISGMEDAANNYARGYNNLGKIHIENLLQIVRKMVNHCDYVSLFEVINSYPGGTGSGLTSLLLERLSDDYPKTYRFDTGIFPSATMSESTVGPYNSLLYTHSTFENLDCGILVDNESMYKKLCTQLECMKPSFSMINRFLAQMLSCIFLSHRYNYQGSQRMDVQELMTNSVPYPRIHFPVLAYAPIFNESQMKHEITKPSDLIRQIFETNSHFLNCPMQFTKYISCCLLFRGLVSPASVYKAVSVAKNNGRVRFVDWCPTGFKIGISNQPSLSTPNHALAASSQTLCMIAGNVGIKEAWRMLQDKYEHLISKRAFIHWYIGEGLEESDFHDSNEDIKVLVKDYEEIAKDSESNDEVTIATVKSAKNRYSTNTYQQHPKLDRNQTISKTMTMSQPLSVNNSHTKAYSQMLYEDLISRLSTKFNSSNCKMIRKLNKLQSRLSQMNQIYVDNLNESENRRKQADKGIPTKTLIRQEIMKKLAFSTKEHIVCSPSNNFISPSNNVPELTHRVTNDTSVSSESTGFY